MKLFLTRLVLITLFIAIVPHHSFFHFFHTKTECFKKNQNKNLSGTAIIPIRFDFAQLHFDFAEPGSNVKCIIDFNYHPEDMDRPGQHGNHKPWFELNYTYENKNGELKYLSSPNVSNGSLHFLIPLAAFQGQSFIIYFDLHQYFWSPLEHKEIRGEPKLKTYSINLNQITKSKNILLTQNENTKTVIFPDKITLNISNQIVVNDSIELRIQYLYSRAPYYLISNYKIIFMSPNISINNFLINTSKQLILNLQDANFDELPININIESNEITFTQNIETYFNPLLSKIAVGHSLLFNSILGICVNPFIKNENLNFIINMDIKFFLNYHLSLTIFTNAGTPIFSNQTGIFKMTMPNFINDLLFLHGDSMNLNYADLN